MVTKQQLIWNAIRILKGFDINHVKIILCNDRISEKQITKFLALLTKAGYLVKVPNSRGYRLVKKVGAIAPKVRNNKGQERELYDPNTGQTYSIPARTKKETNTSKIFNEIEIGKEYSLQDIVSKTKIAKQSVRTVLKRLMQQGIVTMVRIERKRYVKKGIYVFNKEKKDV